MLTLLVWTSAMYLFETSAMFLFYKWSINSLEIASYGATTHFVTNELDAGPIRLPVMKLLKPNLQKLLNNPILLPILDMMALYTIPQMIVWLILQLFITVVYRPDGKQLACSTLDGQIHFWDPIKGVVMYTIEDRRDIAGGRLMTDRRSAANSSSGKYFATLCYSADGSYILAGGSRKYICMYDIANQLSEDGPSEEPSGDDMLSSFNEWSLPAKEYNGMWESLIYETGLKQRLLRYAASALLFTKKGVDPCLVSWNRIILLHGPPGTKKISVCKALAQKLSIHFSSMYPHWMLPDLESMST